MIFSDEEVERINNEYDKANEEQLIQWMNGNPTHNKTPKIIIQIDNKGNVINHDYLEGGECCPDFSCCEPSLLWPLDQRILFMQRKDLRSNMLMMSLHSLAASKGKAIYIAGEECGNA